MSYIDESTYKSLIVASERLVQELEAHAVESGLPLPWARIMVANQAKELARVARAQAMAAGVTMERSGA